MRKVNQGSLLTWRVSGQSDHILPGYQGWNSAFHLFSKVSETFGIYINVPIPESSMEVRWLSNGVDVGSAGSLTVDTVEGQKFAYGTITAPANYGAYTPKITTGGATWIGTPFVVTDNAFCNDNTMLVSFRNRYTIDNVYYPHLSNNNFRQSFRLMGFLLNVEPVTVMEEYRSPWGAINHMGKSKAIQYRVSFLNLDEAAQEALVTTFIHDDIKVNDISYLASEGFAPGEFSRGYTSNGSVLLERLNSAWAESRSNL